MWTRVGADARNAASSNHHQIRKERQDQEMKILKDIFSFRIKVNFVFLLFSLG